MNPLAQLDVTMEADTMIARLDGEIDISNAADLGAALEAAIPNTALGLVLDLSETGYIDSAGVHLLFGLGSRLTRRRQQLRVVVPDDAPIKKVLSLTGVSWTVPQDTSVADALSRMRLEVQPLQGEDSWVSSGSQAPWF